MSANPGNGNSKPQTLTGRIMAAFTGHSPARSPEDGESESPDILPPEERKAAMSSLDPSEAKWSLAALALATLTAIGFPAYYIVANPKTKVDGKYVAVSPDAALIGGVLLVLCVIGFLALWKRKRTLLAFVLFLIGFALDTVHPALRIRLHLPRRFSPPPGLAPQQVRNDRFQIDPAAGCGAAPGPAAEGVDTVCLEACIRSRGSEATHRQQALHAEVGTEKEDSQTR